MNDEKTTELELPRAASGNIVRVNFTERRKVRTSQARTSRNQAAAAYTLRPPRGPVRLQTDWSSPWWIRLAALVSILLLSLFVL